MPFPVVLRWALLAPFAIFAVTYLLALAGVQLGADPVAKGVGIALWAGAGIVELLAVPVALFLLVRGGPYVTWGNVTATVLGAIPVAIAAAVLLVLRYGHFHI